MTFSEINMYQVKPDKMDEFESIMKKATEMLQEVEGCELLKFMKRTHYIKDMITIREGLTPDKITRIVKCVRYALYTEFNTAENYGKGQQKLYETYWKSIEKCLIVPHDKFLGDVMF